MQSSCMYFNLVNIKKNHSTMIIKSIEFGYKISSICHDSLFRILANTNPLNDYSCFKHKSEVLKLFFLIYIAVS